MSVRANIDSLQWESEFFGLSTAKLDFAAASAAIILERQLDDYDIVQAKILANETARLDGLSQLGFTLVEGEVDFALTIGIENAYLKGGLSAADRVEPAVTNDIPTLRQAAKHIFCNSRFRTPWYHKGDSGRFYALWIEKAVLGTFDHTCLLVKDASGDVLGFVSLKHLDDDTARIGLLAVMPKANGRGIGRKLMSAAYIWCEQHKKRQLNVATQISNIAALNLYSRSGASIASTAYWLYKGRHDSI